ncbi:hypothetical protein I4U23_004958 [Adineta vaga]|nr:hypothetical protein I4U23_004958 [Adineta vaga]
MLDEECSNNFQSMKAKFQFLFMKRKQRANPWTEVLSIIRGGCSGLSKTEYNWTLFRRYITVNPILSVRKEHALDKLCIYYENGFINSTVSMDDHSRYLVTEFEPLLDSNGDMMWPNICDGLIKCLKCDQKLFLTLPLNEHQPKPYTWYLSYSQRTSLRIEEKKHGHRRIEYIEIYCPACERYSLWKCIAYSQKVHSPMVLLSTTKKRE